MSKLKTLLNKSVGLMSRSVMRTGSIILRRRARLEALSAAIEWFVKRNNHLPLQLTHESDYGDVHLMSDGDRIQLTWWIGDKKQPTDSGHTDTDGDLSPAKESRMPNTPATPTVDNTLRSYHTAQTATAVNAREPDHQAHPRFAPNSAREQPSTMSEGGSVGEAVGDAVGEFIGEVVETVIDAVVDQVCDSTQRKQPVARQTSAAENVPGSPHPR